MKEMCKDFIENFMVVSMDDLPVFRKGIQRYHRHKNAVSASPQKHGMKVSPKMCQFVKEEIECLSV